jgi:hypothetical protein
VAKGKRKKKERKKRHCHVLFGNNVMDVDAEARAVEVSKKGSCDMQIDDMNLLLRP